MTIQEVKEFFKDNADKAEVKKYMVELSQSGKQDIIDDYLNSNDFKKAVDSETDKRVPSAMETAIEKFKKDLMPQEIEAEISKRFPEETEDQKKIRTLEKQFEDMATAKNREELKNKASQLLNNSKISLDALNFINAKDEIDLNKQVEALSKLIGDAKTSGVNETLKIAPQPTDSSGVPVDSTITTRGQLKNIKHGDYIKLRDAGKIKIPGVALEEVKNVS